MAKSYLDSNGLLYFLQQIRPNATPKMDGTAAVGTAKRFANQDHVHPTDTSRAPLASPALTGIPTAPTATAGTNSTQIATTAFVRTAVGTISIPTKTSDLTNDSDFVEDASYVHTDNNYTTAEKNKLSGIAAGAEVNVQADWDVSDPTSDAYIKNKPSIPAGSVVDANLSPTSENAVMNKTIYNALADKVETSAVGAASGVCPLNASSKIDTTYLPSYVDDVIEAYPRSGATALSSNWLSLTSGGTALTPETGKIYILMADSGDYAANSQFRWAGSTYIKLADGGVSAITNAEIDTIVA